LAEPQGRDAFDIQCWQTGYRRLKVAGKIALFDTPGRNWRSAGGAGGVGRSNDPKAAGHSLRGLRPWLIVERAAVVGVDTDGACAGRSKSVGEGLKVVVCRKAASREVTGEAPGFSCRRITDWRQAFFSGCLTIRRWRAFAMENSGGTVAGERRDHLRAAGVQVRNKYKTPMDPSWWRGLPVSHPVLADAGTWQRCIGCA